MSTIEVRSDDATAGASFGNVDMNIEVIVIPVSDVDRAKEFYGASAGGSTPTSPSETRLRVRGARSNSA